MKLNWVRKVFSNGRHNLCVGNFVQWRGSYHICFVDAHHHGALDAQLRVISSPDLESWSTNVAMVATSFDPQLLPVGDRMLIYGVQGDWEGDDFAGFPSCTVVAETGTAARGRRRGAASWPTTTSGLRSSWRALLRDLRRLRPRSGRDERHRRPAHLQRRRNLALGLRGGARLGRVLAHSQRSGPLSARLLAVIRTKLKRALLATAPPPFRNWEHTIVPHSLQGGNAARAGEQVVITGRAADENGEPRTAVFRYAAGKLEHEAVPAQRPRHRLCRTVRRRRSERRAATAAASSPTAGLRARLLAALRLRPAAHPRPGRHLPGVTLRISRKKYTFYSINRDISIHP